MINWNCNGRDMLLDHERSTVEARLLESVAMGKPPGDLGKVYVGQVRVQDEHVWVRTTLDDRLLGTVDSDAVMAHLDKLTS